ncbi:MAG: sterol desaturase family protein [Erythrobacter sp.]|nr:sterol desaturase family protein [Erythrobacter sp.]
MNSAAKFGEREGVGCRNEAARKPRPLGLFLITFALLLVAAEGVLRGVARVQDAVGLAIFNLGVSFEAASFAAALTNAILSLLALVALFGFLEWRQMKFVNFRERYAEGLIYASIGLSIATLLQAVAFVWLHQFEIEPVLRADDLGPLLVLFPILYMIVIGFFEYWLHRALHDIPLLWRLHAIHHQIEEMNAARSYSHWAQDALYLAVITVPLVFLIKSPQQHIVLLTTLYLISNYYMHTDNPAMSFPPALRHVLADNIYHHYHHSRAIEHWGRNYCSFFSFYDRMFGTQHMPTDETFRATGIDGYRPLNGWRDYLVRPFTRKG